VAPEPVHCPRCGRANVYDWKSRICFWCGVSDAERQAMESIDRQARVIFDRLGFIEEKPDA